MEKQQKEGQGKKGHKSLSCNLINLSQIAFKSLSVSNDSHMRGLQQQGRAPWVMGKSACCLGHARGVVCSLAAYFHSHALLVTLSLYLPAATMKNGSVGWPVDKPSSSGSNGMNVPTTSSISFSEGDLLLQVGAGVISLLANGFQPPWPAPLYSQMTGWPKTCDLICFSLFFLSGLQIDI